jgi:hypothetical protein
VSSCRVAGGATPASSASHSRTGAETDPKLTLQPDHLMGADHSPVLLWLEAMPRSETNTIPL